MQSLSKFSFQENKTIPVRAILQLYTDAGWTAYTNKPDELIAAISNSLFVLTAWRDEKLVGLIRVIGDGVTIIYIQDILVLKAFRRQKLGTHLLKHVLEKYTAVRQKVLLTDDTERSRKFYQSMGFASCDKGVVVAYAILGK